MTRPASAHPPRLAIAGYAALVLGGAAVLAACGHSAPTQFFTLDPSPPAVTAMAAYVGPPVRVAAVHIPPSMDREELVSESPEGVMQVHDFEHWEAPLGLTARQTVVEDLVARLPSGAVLGPSASAAGDVATLTADVVSFQVDGDQAVMQAAWSVTLPAPPAGGEMRSWRAPMAQFRIPVSGSGGAATAHAFSAALARLSDQMAASLPAALAQLTAERRATEAAARMTTRMTRTSSTTRTPG